MELWGKEGRHVVSSLVMRIGGRLIATEGTLLGKGRAHVHVLRSINGIGLIKR